MTKGTQLDLFGAPPAAPPSPSPSPSPPTDAGTDTPTAASPPLAAIVGTSDGSTAPEPAAGASTAAPAIPVHDVITSDAYPIDVHWIDDDSTLGSTYFPGRSDVSSSGLRWSRDGAADVERLADHHRVARLILVASEEEHDDQRTHELLDVASEALTTEVLVAREHEVPDDAEEVRRVILGAVSALIRGERVVVASRSGLGRASWLAVAIEAARGGAIDDVIARVRLRRGESTLADAAHVEWLRARETWLAALGHEAQKKVRAGDALVTAITSLAPRSRADRCAGAVLGGAIGDAMGHPTEFMSMSAIADRWGAAGVTGFELWWERDGRRFAPYTDDTQMAEVVLRTLLDARDANEDLDATMQRMARGFVAWAEHPQGGHRAPGNACMSGCRALARGEHWSLAGGATAGGCGSVMRAYPFGLVMADDVERAESWAVEHSKLTHRDPIALAASAAMAVGVARTIRDEPCGAVLDAMIAAAARWSEPTAAMMARALDEANDGVEPSVTLDRLRGWAAHEAIAAAVYVVARHPDDARAAILEGANTPGDSDSIATLAGALVGARVGARALPIEWPRDVERAEELLALAERI